MAVDIDHKGILLREALRIEGEMGCLARAVAETVYQADDPDRADDLAQWRSLHQKRQALIEMAGYCRRPAP